jgi:hypothetical protein
MGNLVQAQTSFAIGMHGAEEMVHQGDIYDDGHAIVRKSPPEYWAVLTVRGQAEAEAATAKARRNRVARAKESESSPVGQAPAASVPEPKKVEVAVTTTVKPSAAHK